MGCADQKPGKISSGMRREALLQDKATYNILHFAFCAANSNSNRRAPNGHDNLLL
jgi:hypothetical protein